MCRLRRNDFGAGRPNSSFQRARSTATPRSGKAAISASSSAESVGSGAMTNLGALAGTADAGALTRGETVDAFFIHLFGCKLEPHPLADSPGKESAHRMALPAGRLN